MSNARSDNSQKSPERPVPRWIEPRKFATKAVTLTGTVSTDALTRLDAVVESIDHVHADLTFDLTEDHRPILKGTLVTRMQQLCQRCLEPVDININTTFQLMMVMNEEQAEQMPKTFEPWFVTDEEADLYSILEEELLLNLPLIANHETACVEKTEFGAKATTEELENVSRSPFDVLKNLKTDK